MRDATQAGRALAALSGGGWTRTAAVAQAVGIPSKSCSAVLLWLEAAGVVQSRRDGRLREWRLPAGWQDARASQLRRGALPEVVAGAAAMLAGGMTTREAAPAAGADPSTVGRWAPAARRCGPRGRVDIDEDRLLGLHLSGSSPTEIGREMGLPRTTVRQRLARILGLPRPGMAAPGS